MEGRVGTLETTVTMLGRTVEKLADADAHHATEIALLRQSISTTMKSTEKIETHMARITTLLDERTGGQKFFKSALWIIATLLAALVALSTLAHVGMLGHDIGFLFHHTVSQNTQYASQTQESGIFNADYQPH